MELKNIVFVVVLAASFGLFGWTSRKVLRYLKFGRAENRFDHFDKRIGNVLAIALGQSKILRDPIAGFVHVGIFWGFLILLSAIAESIGEGFYSEFSFSFFGPLYNFVVLASEIVGVGVLFVVLLALFRRYVVGPDRVRNLDRAEQLDATVVLSSIGIIMISMILLNATRISLGEGAAYAQDWRPVSMALSDLFSNSNGTLLLFEISWWVHIVLVLAFLN